MSQTSPTLPQILKRSLIASSRFFKIEAIHL